MENTIKQLELHKINYKIYIESPNDDIDTEISKLTEKTYILRFKANDKELDEEIEEYLVKFYEEKEKENKEAIKIYLDKLIEERTKRKNK